MDFITRDHEKFQRSNLEVIEVIGSSLEMLKVNDLVSNLEHFHNLKKITFRLEDDDVPSFGFSEKIIQKYF